jgi:hypothetical protein
MKIDTEHLHYWMQAIRQSPDPMRTLDGFWSGQLKSKEWLIEKLEPYVHKPSFIEIHGGWLGILSSMIFQSNIPVTQIWSTDIDPACEPIASMMNKQEEMAGRFKAITADMCHLSYLRQQENEWSVGDIIINTSCEHLTQAQYDFWLTQLPKTALVVVQSNNYDLPEHVRTAKTLEEFKEQSKINAMWSGSLTTKMYERWMIIGYKNI